MKTPREIQEAEEAMERLLMLGAVVAGIAILATLWGFFAQIGGHYADLLLGVLR